MANTNSSNDGQQAAKSILQQLGGNKFIVMTGARNFAALGNIMQFRLPQRFALAGINLVTVKLTGADLYDMEFFKQTSKTLASIAKHEGLYADMLQSTFTDVTGLHTRL